MKKCIFFILLINLFCSKLNASNPEWIKLSPVVYKKLIIHNDDVFSLTYNIDEVNKIIDIYKINLSKGSSRKFTIPFGTHDDLRYGIIYDIDIEDNLWIAISPNRILKLGKTGSVATYELDIEKYPNLIFTSVVIDSDNNKWFGTMFKGLLKFDDIEFTQIIEDNSNFRGDYVYDLFYDDYRKQLWIIGFYLHLMDLLSNEIELIGHINHEIGQIPLIGRALAITKDKNEVIYISFNRFDVVKYDKVESSIIFLDNSKIGFHQLIALAIDSSGVLWGGVWNTEAYGVAKYDGNHWEFMMSDIEEFWTNSVVVDQYNHKWFATQVGLYVYREGGVSDNILGLSSAPSFNISSYNFSIHPNPATDYIYIKFGDASVFGDVKIYNTFGQCVIHLTPTHSEGEGARIDVTHLPPGVYFVRAGNHTEKFVKW